jgi:hypothetical protein
MLTFQPLYLFLYSLNLYFAMIRSLTRSLLQCVLPSSICRSRLLRRDPHSRPNHDAGNEFIVIRSLAEYKYFLSNLADFFPEESIAELPSEQACSICRRRYEGTHDDFPPLTRMTYENVAPWPPSLQNGHTGLDARELPFANDPRNLVHEEGPIQDTPSPSPVPSSNYSRTLGFEDFQSDYSVSTDSVLNDLNDSPDFASLNEITDQDSAIRLPCGHIFGLECLRRWFAPRSEMGGGGTTCPLCRRVVYVLDMGYVGSASMAWDEEQMDALWREVWGYESEDRRTDRVIAARDRAAAAGQEGPGGDRVVGDLGEGGLQRHQRTQRQVWSRLAGVVVGENGRVRRRDGLLTPVRRGSSF